MPSRYWLETLGCPKNQVDSDKLAGLLEADGFRAALQPHEADLVLVNTCAFIEAAREESIETVLALAASKKEGARVVVTGCMAERYGDELAQALPEVDRVAGFGVPVHFGPARRAGTSAPAGDMGRPLPSFDLLNLPRPPARAPWAYVKVAEGCDRRCGFCAIPTFRGPQRSRSRADILAEVESLGAREVVLVAQDLVSWGRDLSASRGAPGCSPRAPGEGGGPEIVGLFKDVIEMVDRARLLYLYPSGLTDELIEAVGTGGCPYFDLSLQHVSRPLLRKMRRFGEGERFLAKIAHIRRRFPDASFRSSFIIGYPGETEEDHDALLNFLGDAQLDWVGFFPFSNEDGTYAAGLPGHVPAGLVSERMAECSELQDSITAARRSALVGTKLRVLVDAAGVARSHREAPEIDGIVQVPPALPVGTWADVAVVDALGPDLVAEPLF